MEFINIVKNKTSVFFSFFKKLTFVKKILFVVVAIVLLAFIFNRLKGKPQNYVLEAVRRTDIVQTVTETGNIESGAVTKVISPGTGVIDEVDVENGQDVKTGDTLFKVKSTATQQEQQEAYSNYLASVATLNAAKSGLDALSSTMYSKWKIFYDLATNSTYENSDKTPKTENRVLVEFNTAQRDWLAAEANVRDQQTVIAQAQAKVSSTWLLYQATQDANVLAQADGQVANLALVPGNGIKAGDTALVILNQAGTLIAKAAINEVDIPKIREGQIVKIDIDAIDNKSFEGSVERVDSVGTNTQGVITYNVYVRLNDADPEIRSGMTATTDIETASIKNVLSVPNNAVKPYRGGRAVQILDAAGKIKYIPVQTGVKGDDRTQIINGVSEGQKIITGAKNAAIQRQGMFGF